jgi:hypothetical protein
MSDKCNHRELPPRSAIELLKEAELEEKVTTDILGREWVKHSTGIEFQEDHIR